MTQPHAIAGTRLKSTVTTQSIPARLLALSVIALAMKRMNRKMTMSQSDLLRECREIIVAEAEIIRHSNTNMENMFVDEGCEGTFKHYQDVIARIDARLAQPEAPRQYSPEELHEVAINTFVPKDFYKNQALGDLIRALERPDGWKPEVIMAGGIVVPALGEHQEATASTTVGQPEAPPVPTQQTLDANDAYLRGLEIGRKGQPEAAEPVAYRRKTMVPLGYEKDSPKEERWVLSTTPTMARAPTIYEWEPLYAAPVAAQPDALAEEWSTARAIDLTKNRDAAHMVAVGDRMAEALRGKHG